MPVELQQATFGEAHYRRRGNYEMIEDSDVHQRQWLLERLRHCFVRAARLGNAGRVIVSSDPRDFSELLLGERCERYCERASPKRNEQFAAIIHCPPSQVPIMPAYAKDRRLTSF